LKKSIEARDEELAELKRQEGKETQDGGAELLSLGVEVERQLTMAEAALL